VKIAFVAGPPGCGKTQLIVHALTALRAEGVAAGVLKLDAVTSYDAGRYEALGIPARMQVAGEICPDHEAMVSLGPALAWARECRLDLLVIETAGLCDRCSPFLRRALAVFVVNGLSHLGTPRKMRAMVAAADLVVMTRCEGISPAERQVFLGTLKALNPGASVIVANGLTGEGTWQLARAFREREDLRVMDLEPLRTTLPRGYCHFCQGTESGHA
jgi:Ni2+-binding GTPase involved in maturation of urease and hydrogenase